MRTISFECEIVTPLFSRGALPIQTELLAQTIKHGMVFWWRAVQKATSLNELKNKEFDIFGSGKDLKSSAFEISLVVDNSAKNEIFKYNKFIWDHIKGNKPIGVDSKIEILNYLAYGVANSASYFPAETLFSIRITFKRFLDETIKKEIIQSLVDLSLFGGLGAKSRNGFGKFTFNLNNFKEIFSHLEIINFDSPKNRFEILKEKTFKETELQNYTSFSNKSNLIFFLENEKIKDSNYQQFETWEDSLFEIGKRYRTARCGNNFSLNKYDGVDLRHEGEKRKFIASPFNTEKTIIGERGREYKIRTKGIFNDQRQAKSIFFNIRKNNNDKFECYLLYLPCIFPWPNNAYQENYETAYSDLISKIKTNYTLAQ